MNLYNVTVDALDNYRGLRCGSSRDLPQPRGWGGRGQGVRLQQDNLHRRHAGDEGGGVDTEPSNVSPENTAVNFAKLFTIVVHYYGLLLVENA